MSKNTVKLYQWRCVQLLKKMLFYAEYVLFLYVFQFEF